MNTTEQQLKTDKNRFIFSILWLIFLLIYGVWTFFGDTLIKDVSGITVVNNALIWVKINYLMNVFLLIFVVINLIVSLTWFHKMWKQGISV